jgi:ATP-dependent DNA helicase MPH1
VCLPTGLGKTHIASVIILNYYRWFPTGKIYFLAPTRPLVYQQKNCLASYSQWVDEDQVTEVNGEVPAAKRARIYDNKRVFFMTPQTLDNDLTEDRCPVKDTVLVIIGNRHGYED